MLLKQVRPGLYAIALVILSFAVSVGGADRTSTGGESQSTLLTNGKGYGQWLSASTPNFESGQIYLDSFYVRDVWGENGGTGSGIKVIVVEASRYNDSHEDLQGLNGFFIGTIGQHATSTVGIIAADSNTFGMTGMAFDVAIGGIAEIGYGIADAIYDAVDSSAEGDVIVVNYQHSYGGAVSDNSNHGKTNPDQMMAAVTYVPAEYYDTIYNAVAYAVGEGRIVVEAAANGDGSLNTVGEFDPDYRHSGALIVGSANANHTRYSSGGLGSNYGDRVDLQGYGFGVYSLGYTGGSGNDTVLYGTDTQDFTDYYRSGYSATSAATPQVAGACALAQSMSYAENGRYLSAWEMSSILKRYSTPQGADSSTNPIGPMPRLDSVAWDLQLDFYSVIDTFISWWQFLDVDFEVGDSGTADYLWDFGDGTTSTSNVVTHRYDTTGLFTVKLSQIVGYDTTTIVRPDLIRVNQRFDFSADITVLSSPDCEVSFTASADSTPTAWIWDFGDGQSSTSQSPTHSYDTVGVYDVKLSIVFDGDTSTVTKTAYIEVEENCCLSSTGNVNGDPSDRCNITDISYLNSYLYSSGPPPPCMFEADVDGSGTVDSDDHDYLADYLFGSGPAPVTCSNNCLAPN